MKKIFSITLLVLIVAFSSFSFANAAPSPIVPKNSCPACPEPGGFVPCGRSCDDPDTPESECEDCTLCHLFVMIDSILDFLFMYAVPAIAALMIAIGGMMMVFSYSGGLVDAGGGKKGGPALLNQAKKLFTSVVVGLIIVYGAWIFVNFFLMAIGVANWTGLRDGWANINCNTSGQPTSNPTPSTTPSTVPPVPSPVPTPGGGVSEEAVEDYVDDLFDIIPDASEEVKEYVDDLFDFGI